MGMSSLVLDNDEMFYSAADDVKLECNNLEEFIALMTPQMDLVAYTPKSQVIEILKEIYYG
jgi:hypothetical protein